MCSLRMGIRAFICNVYSVHILHAYYTYIYISCIMQGCAYRSRSGPIRIETLWQYHIIYLCLGSARARERQREIDEERERDRDEERERARKYGFAYSKLKMAIFERNVSIFAAVAPIHPSNWADGKIHARTSLIYNDMELQKVDYFASVTNP